jgi:hypothetical protein
MEQLKDRIAEAVYPEDVERQLVYKQKLEHNHHWQFDSLTNKNVEKWGKWTTHDVMFGHIIHEGSKKMKRFSHLKPGDIAEKRGDRWHAIANIYEPYVITRQIRGGRVRYSDRYYFKISPCADERVVELLLQNDFFYDEGTLTEDEMRCLVSRIMSRDNPVEETQVPLAVLKLLPVQRVRDRYYHCYRSLPHQLGTFGVSRTKIAPDTPVYTQADLFEAMGLPMTEENVMNNIIC